MTAAAVLSPESAPSLAGAPSPQGGLLSGVSSSSGSRGVPVPRTASIRTTLAGMSGGVATPSPTSTVPSALETTHTASDRRATTNSIVATDTLPMPQNGTEALAPPSRQASLGEVDTEIQWPAQRAPMPSDEPQVRSLVPTSQRRTVWPVVIASSALAIAALIAIRLVPYRAGSAAGTAVDTKAIMVAPEATHVPASTYPEVIPAPMIAVPAFQDLPPRADPSAVPVRPLPSSEAPSGAKAAALAPLAAPPRRSNAIASPKDRPGPGF